MLALAAFIVVGCKSKKETETNNNLTAFERGLNYDDSIFVVAAVDNFFGLLEAGNVDLAVSTLFKVNPEDVYKEPLALNNEEMAEVRKVFEVFPIIRHRIDYIKFYESYLNEVKVTAVFREADGDIPEGTTTYYLRAINNVGQWVLCAMNTWTGDDVALVRDEDKDSLTRKFQQDKRRLDSIVIEATKDILPVNTPNSK